MYPAGGGELFVHRAPDQREELASLLERQSQSVVIDIVPHHPQATPPLTCAPSCIAAGTCSACAVS